MGARVEGVQGALEVLRRQLGLVMLCALLAAGAALALSLQQDDRYSASAVLLFRDSALDQTAFGSPFLFAPQMAPKRQAATNVELVSLVAGRTAKRLGGAVSAASVRTNVEVAAKGESDLVSITAADGDPKLAAKLANGFASEFIHVRRRADRSKIRDAQRLVARQLADLDPSERGSSRARALRKRAEELAVLPSLQMGNAELVQRARIPDARSAPKPARAAVLGGLVGLLLGVALAFLIERLDRRLRRPEEVEQAFGLTILGRIPENPAIARAGLGPTILTGSEGEPFRALRAKLRHLHANRELRSLLVTSAVAGEGKTTVALNLAAAAARSGARVLAIEADLRHPVLARSLGLSSEMGLSLALADTDGAQRATVELPVAEAAIGVDPSSRSRIRSLSLAVMPAGPLPPNPGELIESRRMLRLLRQAEERYDLVVIDTPPASVIADAFSLMAHVSGVIVVSRLNQTTREDALSLAAQFDHLDAPLLGVVLDGVEADEPLLPGLPAGRTAEGPVASIERHWLWLAGALAVAGAGALSVLSSAWAVLAASVVAAALAAVGVEVLILVAWLAAVGLMPFVDPFAPVFGGFPIWVPLFAFACGLMVFAWGARKLAAERSWPPQPSSLMVLVMVLLAYTGLRLAGSRPLEDPGLSSALLAMPVSALLTCVWLSHEQALVGVRRALPLVIVVVASWSVAYIAASAGGCSQCLGWVASQHEEIGLLGPHSRVYTPGQNAQLGLVLIAFGYVLRRPSSRWIGLTALGLASIALQGFRAQYVALLCGMLVLLAWRLGELERGRRGLLLGLAVVAFAGFLVSPVGQRALTSYGELRASSGNVGYRLRLIEETSQGWSVFGAGVSAGVIPQDVTFDLGVPNTLIALGFVGAGLQLALLAAGFLRSLSAQTLAGATLAAIFALEIVARPSLPELESGPGALTAGVAVGFACALSVRRGPRYT